MLIFFVTFRLDLSALYWLSVFSSLGNRLIFVSWSALHFTSLLKMHSPADIHFGFLQTLLNLFTEKLWLCATVLAEHFAVQSLACQICSWNNVKAYGKMICTSFVFPFLHVSCIYLRLDGFAFVYVSMVVLWYVGPLHFGLYFDITIANRIYWKYTCYKVLVGRPLHW